MKDNYIWSTKRWMLRRRELKRNDKKKKQPQSLLVSEATREHFVKLTCESFISIFWASGCWEESSCHLVSWVLVWGVFSSLALRFGHWQNMRIQKMFICKCYRTRKILGWFQRKTFLPVSKVVTSVLLHAAPRAGLCAGLSIAGAAEGVTLLLSELGCRAVTVPGVVLQCELLEGCKDAAAWCLICGFTWVLATLQRTEEEPHPCLLALMMTLSSGRGALLLLGPGHEALFETKILLFLPAEWETRISDPLNEGLFLL